MGRGRRVSLVVLALGVAAVAFVLIKPDGQEPVTQTQQRTVKPSAGNDGQSPRRSVAPEPEVSTIRIENGQPVGGVEKIEARSGDVVRIVVSSDVTDELHLHGFDLAEEVGPDRDAELRFKADIEGVFELELERRGVEIAQLEVQP